MEDDGSADSEDRIALSRDLDLLADRIAVQGAGRRAHELKLVAAMLRDKAARPTEPTALTRSDPAPEARNRLDDYLLAASLLVGWLIVVLALVALASAALGGTPKG